MKIELFNLLRKFDFLDLLKVEESYYNSFDLKKTKKLSKEVVLLNYAEHSPYSNFDIFYNIENEKVNLWYTDKEFDATIVLPESVVFTKYFVKNKVDGIIVFDTHPKKLIVIKDGVLQRQFSKNEIAPYEISLLKKEFAVDGYHVYNTQEYQEYFKYAVESLSLKNILDFFSFEFNYKNLIDVIVKKISIPLSVFVSVLLFIEFLNYFYVQDRLKGVEKEYSAVKEKTQMTRDSVNEIQDMTGKYIKLEKEFDNNKKLIKAVDSVSGIIKDANASFLFLRISENEFRIKVDTNQTSQVFTKIVNLGYFEDLKIQSAVKNRRDPGEKVIVKGEVKW